MQRKHVPSKYTSTILEKKIYELDYQRKLIFSKQGANDSNFLIKILKNLSSTCRNYIEKKPACPFHFIYHNASKINAGKKSGFTI